MLAQVNKQCKLSLHLLNYVCTSNAPVKSTPVTLNGLEQSVRDLGSGSASVAK